MLSKVGASTGRSAVSLVRLVSSFSGLLAVVIGAVFGARLPEFSLLPVRRDEVSRSGRWE